MRILFVIPYFVPAFGFGGPIRVCFETAKALIKRGHAVTVATTDALDEKRRISLLEETIDGVRIVRFRNVSPWLAKRLNGYLPIGFYTWMRFNIAGFDAVWCHDFFTWQNLAASHVCFRNSVPYIIQPHGALSLVRQTSRFRLAKHMFIALFSRALRHANKLVALTEHEKNEILALGHIEQSKVAIVPNGINCEEFSGIERIDLHAKFGIPRDRRLIGYIGRLQYIKGLDIAVDVLARIRSRLSFTYLIIGPDEGQKEALLKQIAHLGLQDCVFFAGLLQGREKLSVLKSCDLCLFTSRSEGLPMSVLEAAALGVPQIISTECNVPEIGTARAGFVFDLDRKNEMADKIVELFSRNGELQELSRNAHALAHKTFDVQIMIRKIEELLAACSTVSTHA